MCFEYVSESYFYKSFVTRLNDIGFLYFESFARKLVKISKALFAILSYIILEKQRIMGILEPIIALEAVCARKNNYLEILG